MNKIQKITQANKQAIQQIQEQLALKSTIPVAPIKETGIFAEKKETYDKKFKEFAITLKVLVISPPNDSPMWDYILNEYKQGGKTQNPPSFNQYARTLNATFNKGGKLTIGDNTTAGIIQDETDTQYKINGNWYAKKVVKAKEQSVLPNDISSDNFKKWFGNSKVVDENGDPLIVYHGTTHEFFEFKKERGNVENDFGVGFYFSSSFEDVEDNYATETGQDITTRVEQLAERYEGELDLDKDTAYNKALKELTGDKNITIEAYLSFQNPFIIGGDNETYLDTEYDEENEEEMGLFPAFIEALTEGSYMFDDVEIGEVISILQENVGYEGGTASEIVDALTKIESFSYVLDDEGKVANKELLRLAIEQTGFDGIIDNTVYDKFGAGSGRMNYMVGINPDTTHYIAFFPTQIKSATDNNGEYNPNNPNILMAKGGQINKKNKFLGQSEEINY